MKIVLQEGIGPVLHERTAGLGVKRVGEDIVEIEVPEAEEQEEDAAEKQGSFQCSPPVYFLSGKDFLKHMVSRGQQEKERTLGAGQCNRQECSVKKVSVTRVRISF
jgi:hypothetical protein